MISKRPRSALQMPLPTFIDRWLRPVMRDMDTWGYSFRLGSTFNGSEMMPKTPGWLTDQS